MVGEERLEELLILNIFEGRNYYYFFPSSEKKQEQISGQVVKNQMPLTN